MSSNSKVEKKLLILCIDCTDEELKSMFEDIYFALSCVTRYRFVITNRRVDSLTRKDLLQLLARLSTETPKLST